MSISTEPATEAFRVAFAARAHRQIDQQEYLQAARFFLASGEKHDPASLAVARMAVKNADSVDKITR